MPKVSIDEFRFTLSQVAYATNVRVNTLKNQIARNAILDPSLVQAPSDAVLSRNNARTFSTRAVYRIGIVQELVAFGFAPGECVHSAVRATDVFHAGGPDPSTCRFPTGWTYLVGGRAGGGEVINFQKDDFTNGMYLLEPLSGSYLCTFHLNLGALFDDIDKRLNTLGGVA